MLLPYATITAEQTDETGVELGDLLAATELIDEELGWQPLSAPIHVLLLPRRIVIDGLSEAARASYDVRMHVESVDGDSGGGAETEIGWPTRIVIDKPPLNGPAYQVVGVMGFGSLKPAGDLTAELAEATVSASFLDDPIPGEVYTIESEVIYVLDTTPATVARGQALTSSATHATGVAIQRVCAPFPLEAAARRVAGRVRIDRDQPGNLIDERGRPISFDQIVPLDTVALSMIEPFRAPSGSFVGFDRRPVLGATSASSGTRYVTQADFDAHEADVNSHHTPPDVSSFGTAAALTTHVGVAAAHHTAPDVSDFLSETVIDAKLTTHTSDADAHHTPPDVLGARVESITFTAIASTTTQDRQQEVASVPSVEAGAGVAELLSAAVGDDSFTIAAAGVYRFEYEAEIVNAQDRARPHVIVRLDSDDSALGYDNGVYMRFSDTQTIRITGNLVIDADDTDVNVVISNVRTEGAFTATAGGIFRLIRAA